MKSFLRYVLGLSLLINVATFSQAQAAGRCEDHLRAAGYITGSIATGASRDVRTSNATSEPANKPKLNSSARYKEVLDIEIAVRNNEGTKVGSSLKEAAARPEIQSVLNGPHRAHQILLRAKLSAREGDGELHMVTLDIGAGNRAYNHVELAALLRTNPELANALGIYRVEDHEDVAWVPDMKTLNYRLNLLAKQYGYPKAKWSYGPAEGVVSTHPYLQLLADGKFPFSSERDVNLSIHDSMHAVAFAVMNITPGGREVLDIAKIRNQVILKIYDRIQRELPQTQYGYQFLENHAKWLSPDSLERTMLLTIIMTGNYDYFSAHTARQQGRFFTPQNKTATAGRIKQLLKLFIEGQKTFGQTLDALAPQGDVNRETLHRIFVEETRPLRSMTDDQLAAAAQQIMKFMPRSVMTDSGTGGSILISPGFSGNEPAGPETLQP